MSDQNSIHQARAAAASGDIKTAAAILGEAIRQDPRDVEAWLALSDIVEEPQQAEECLYRVLQIDPGNPVALRRLSGELLEDDPGLAAGAGAPPGPVDGSVAALEPEASNGFYPEPSISGGTVHRDPDPTRPLAEAGAPIPAAAAPLPVEAPPKRPSSQAPGAKKSAQKKRKGISGLEIFLLSIIGFLILCLGAAGVASLAGGAAQEPDPTSSPGEVTAVIYENIRASNAMDSDAYMATIHTGSPSYSTTKDGLEVLFSGEFHLSYGLSDVYVIEQGSSSAVVHFVLTTRRISGPSNFRDNQVEGEMTLRKEGGAWKIYGQKVTNIDYLD
jgi:hypothetical protein